MRTEQINVSNQSESEGEGWCTQKLTQSHQLRVGVPKVNSDPPVIDY